MESLSNNSTTFTDETAAVVADAVIDGSNNDVDEPVEVGINTKDHVVFPPNEYLTLEFEMQHRRSATNVLPEYTIPNNTPEESKVYDASKYSWSLVSFLILDVVRIVFVLGPFWPLFPKYHANNEQYYYPSVLPSAAYTITISNMVISIPLPSAAYVVTISHMVISILAMIYIFVKGTPQNPDNTNNNGNQFESPLHEWFLYLLAGWNSLGTHLAVLAHIICMVESFEQSNYDIIVLCNIVLHHPLLWLLAFIKLLPTAEDLYRPCRAVIKWIKNKIIIIPKQHQA